MTNAARHADASAVAVALGVANGEAVLSITDDGIGMGQAPVEGRTSGNGLPNMSSRAEQVGGTLELESGPTNGTRIVIRVPLAGPDEG